jgi:ATP-dependent RNA/DNA helicase IGHMBP2
MEEPHLDRLLRLLDLEREEERARLDRLLATLSPEERAARGITLLDVVCVDESWGLGGRVQLELEREDRAPLGARIDQGDLVDLRPRRAEVAAPARGLVARRTRTRVTVSFDQPPPPWAREGRLLVDLRPNDVTSARARANVLALRNEAPSRGATRRSLVLGERPPRFARLVEVPHPTFNAEQRDALARVAAAEELCLVHGPPGTGKTTVLVEAIAREVRAGRRVLVLAPSNAAVDLLVERTADAGLAPVRMGHPSRAAERLYPFTLEGRVEAHANREAVRNLFDEAFGMLGYARRQRARGRSADRWQNAREASGEGRKLLSEARARERQMVREVMARARVVCATCSTAAGGDLDDEPFDVAFCDEATQATEPVTLVAFLRAPRVVLAGDHCQLPPTVLSRAAQDGGLGVSLFERMVRLHGESARTMLREQHRMSEALMRFPSAQMYNGELRAHPSVAGRTLAEVLTPGADVDAGPVLFVDTAGRGWDEARGDADESRRNPAEAECVVRHLARLLDAGLDPAEVAVISPYAAQVALLRDLVAARGLAAGVEVDTIDAFQGREKDAVLVSTVRSNADGQIGFLRDLRRMNVAITRARRHLFVVGDAATLASEPYYQAFVAHAEACDGYRSAWSWPGADDIA